MKLLPYEVLLVYFNVFLYAFCYQLQAPFIRYLTDSLGIATEEYGRIASWFAFLQFFGGLLSGPLIDHFGTKALLVVNFGASFLNYTLMATATDAWMVYMAMIPTLLQHAVLVSRVFISKLHTGKEGTRMLSYIGVAYGFGFALGPFIGGQLSKHYTTQTGAYVAAMGSLVSVLLCFALPSSKAPEQAANAGTGRSDSKSLAKSFTLLWNTATQTGVPAVLARRGAVSFGASLLHSLFSVALTEHFGIPPESFGILMTYAGVIGIIFQAVGFRVLQGLMSPATLYRLALAGYVLSLGVGALVAPGGYAVYVMGLSTTFFVPAVFLLDMLLMGTLNDLVPPDRGGSAHALNMGLGSAMRMVAPSLASFAYLTFGFTYSAAAVAAAASLLLLTPAPAAHSHMA